MAVFAPPCRGAALRLAPAPRLLRPPICALCAFESDVGARSCALCGLDFAQALHRAVASDDCASVSSLGADEDPDVRNLLQAVAHMGLALDSAGARARDGSSDGGDSVCSNPAYLRDALVVPWTVPRAAVRDYRDHFDSDEDGASAPYEGDAETVSLSDASYERWRQPDGDDESFGVSSPEHSDTEAEEIRRLSKRRHGWGSGSSTSSRSSGQSVDDIGTAVHHGYPSAIGRARRSTSSLDFVETARDNVDVDQGHLLRFHLDPAGLHLRMQASGVRPRHPAISPSGAESGDEGWDDVSDDDALVEVARRISSRATRSMQDFLSTGDDASEVQSEEGGGDAELADSDVQLSETEDDVASEGEYIVGHHVGQTESGFEYGDWDTDSHPRDEWGDSGQSDEDDLEWIEDPELGPLELLLVDRDSPAGSDWPAPSSVIRALPTHCCSEEEVAALPPEAQRCTICLENYQAGEEQSTLPCFHRYHTKCVNAWLRRVGTCPICKHSAEDGIGQLGVD